MWLTIESKLASVGMNEWINQNTDHGFMIHPRSTINMTNWLAMRWFGIFPPCVRVMVLQDLKMLMRGRQPALRPELDHLEGTFNQPAGETLQTGTIVAVWWQNSSFPADPGNIHVLLPISPRYYLTCSTLALSPPASPSPWRTRWAWLPPTRTEPWPCSAWWPSTFPRRNRRQCPAGTPGRSGQCNPRHTWLDPRWICRNIRSLPMEDFAQVLFAQLNKNDDLCFNISIVSDLEYRSTTRESDQSSLAPSELFQ